MHYLNSHPIIILHQLYVSYLTRRECRARKCVFKTCKYLSLLGTCASETKREEEKIFTLIIKNIYLY